MHSPAVWLELYRYLTGLMGSLILFKMIDWLKAYYKGMYKQRERLTLELNNTPLKWWFVLFCGLGLLVVAVSLGNLYAAYRDFPFNPISVLVLPGEITVFIGLSKTYAFVKSMIEKKVDERRQ